MAGYLKSSDLGPHAHGYGAPHPHHAHAHGALPPGMPTMTSLPFGLPHGLDSVGFPQGMWGKYQAISYLNIKYTMNYSSLNVCDLKIKINKKRLGKASQSNQISF